MQQLTTKGGFCPLYVQNWFASDQSREKMNDLNTKCPSLSQKGNGYLYTFCSWPDIFILYFPN